MKAISVKYTINEVLLPLEVLLIVGEEQPFKEAVELFYKHNPGTEIIWMSVHNDRVINAWAQ